MFSQFLRGSLAGMCAALSCVPPHVQYLDQLCAFMAGVLIMTLVVDWTVRPSSAARVIDLTDLREPVERTGEEN